MANRWRFLNRNLKRRLQSLWFAAFALVLIGAAFAGWSTLNVYRTYHSDVKETREKLSLLSTVADSADHIALRTRGYFLYLERQEYDAVFDAKDELDAALGQLGRVGLTDSERKLLNETEAFFRHFFDKTFLQGIALAEKRDLEALRNFVYEDGINPINVILTNAELSKQLAQKELDTASDRLIRDLTRQSGAFLGYLLLVLLTFMYLSKRIATDITQPLSTLSRLSATDAEGADFTAELTGRQDEVGSLSRAMRRMFVSIREKEEELLAQNEELIAQQDELHAQQAELQDALSKMTENEAYLERLNAFTRSMSYSLDKQSFLDSTIRQLVELADMEKGFIALTDTWDVHASFGMGSEDAGKAIDTMAKGGFTRVLETKQPYVRKREATSSERGLADEGLFSCDVLLPVLDENDVVVACAVLVRVGRDIEATEKNELIGFAAQIALALSRIAQYEETEHQRRLVRDILDTIHEGVQLQGLDGKTLQVNAKMLSMLGIRKAASEIRLDHSTFDRFEEIARQRVRDPETLIAFAREAIFGNGVRQSIMYELLGEDRQVIELYAEPLYADGNRTGTLLVHRDITKEFEVDRMKSEFVSTVSHELRTPLASVLGFAELLLHREMSPERQRKYVATIHREAQRLTNLVNDFLDLQRMESGRQTYERKEIDMAALLRDIAAIQRAVSDRHVICLQVSGDGRVFGDEDKLRQAFVNLVGNALKYSPQGGTVDIRCVRKGPFVVVEVADEGLGIPEEAMAGLFQKFYRVDNSDRRSIGGTGLGLAIVKEVVERHNGEVGVVSALGKGSTFVVKLPALEMSVADVAKLSVKEMELSELPVYEAAAASEEAGEPTAAGPRATIAIVENDRSLTEMLTVELHEHGFAVAVYDSAAAAESALALPEPALRPDIVVVDLMLEQISSGWGLIEKLKALEATKNVPIVVSSALEEKEKAASLGVAAYLVKPYPSAKLSAVVNRLLVERR